MRIAHFTRSVLLGVVVTLGPGCAGGTLQVGVVDGTRVVRTTKRGKDIRKKIEQESGKLEVTLSKMQAAVKQLATEVGALAKTPANPALKKKRRALQLAKTALRETHLRFQKQLNEFGQRLLNQLKEAIRKVAMEIKERRGLDLVIMRSRGEGLWIWPVVDITDQVVQQLDSTE